MFTIMKLRFGNTINNKIRFCQKKKNIRIKYQNRSISQKISITNKLYLATYFLKFRNYKTRYNVCPYYICNKIKYMWRRESTVQLLTGGETESLREKEGEGEIRWRREKEGFGDKGFYRERRGFRERKRVLERERGF